MSSEYPRTCRARRRWFQWVTSFKCILCLVQALFRFIDILGWLRTATTSAEFVPIVIDWFVESTVFDEFLTDRRTPQCRTEFCQWIFTIEGKLWSLRKKLLHGFFSRNSSRNKRPMVLERPVVTSSSVSLYLGIKFVERFSRLNF